MKIIPRKIHGYIDYIVGIVLILAPYLLGFAHTGPASSTPIACGIIIIASSALTNYETGIFKIIPFKFHLALDFVLGALLALSPWLFNFWAIVWVPHVLVGAMEMIIPFLTQPYGRTAEYPSGKQL